MKVTFLKAGHRMAITPVDTELYSYIEPALSYTEKRMLYGEERRLADSHIELIDWACYAYDNQGRLCCPFGFYHKLRELLKIHKHKVVIKDLRPEKNKKVFNPDWDRVFRFAELRYGQDKFILKAAAHQCGRFSCPPGYGKSFLIALMAQAFPKAKIDVTTTSAGVARNLYSELLGMMPNVGLIGGGKHNKGKRVQVYCSASLHHSDYDADFMFADEVHELAADRYAESLARYQQTRMFGFSATHDMRLDNKDMRLEGVFGPIVYHLENKKCVEEGLIVPISILWRPVVMDSSPCEGMTDTERMKYGIWRNKYRNSLIAKDAAYFYKKGLQVLIAVRTVEHLVHLKKEFKELGINLPLVYAETGMEERDRKRYLSWGLIDDDEPYMTTKRRKQQEVDFKSGEMKIAACNSVWDTGMNFPQLQALVRGDALGSAILDTQLPGRTSRLDDDKYAGVVIDYMDQFDPHFAAKAKARESNYKRNDWEQIKPQASKSKFRQTFLFG
jgi:superfamily II DNA or RNA helicase